MRYHHINYSVIAIAVVGVLLLLSQTTPAAQNQAAAGTAATPRLSDGHPDFTGFYNRDHFLGDPVEEALGDHVVTRLEDGSAFFSYGGSNLPQFEPEVEENQPPYRPEYMERAKRIGDAAYGRTSAEDPQMECKPLGVPRAGLSIMQLVHKPNVLAILHEARPGPVFRVIYLDERPHPEGLDNSYMGHSIGHWEGDTLVIDTVGLNDETWIAGGFDAPKYALIHSDQLHVTERWTRNGNQITVETTLRDPVMFTEPWKMDTKSASLAPEWDWIQPQMCVPLDKEHIVTNEEMICGWCNPKSLYGGEGEDVTAPGAVE